MTFWQSIKFQFKNYPVKTLAALILVAAFGAITVLVFGVTLPK